MIRTNALRGAVVTGYNNLTHRRLICWTEGNISVRGGRVIAIKPSGMLADTFSYLQVPLLDIDVGLTDLKGSAMLKPSTDTADHCHLYRAFPDLRAIVHTHSPAATAFAIAGSGIPCSMTMLADEFGGRVPCAPYARIGGTAIGESVQPELKPGQRAILLAKHGVLTFGWNPDPVLAAEEAVKSAAMLELCAQTLLHLGANFDNIKELPGDEIAAAHKRYTETYGQR